ncbi:hypothetical protein BGW42_006564 [Actinomortierella wolfii]|nr:hypothetical protein BGW42_006564 [Actinomortierella wolfii]
MNSIAEATKSTINTIKIRALLSKALNSDPNPTPGYLFPKIASASKTPGGSDVILAQLLKIITPSKSQRSNNTSTSVVVESEYHGHQSNTTNNNASVGTALSSAYGDSVHVILKAIKILRQLAQTGSVEIRMQMARQAKQPLANLVGFRGEWDPIHGDQFNINIRQAAEDLIEYLHAHPVTEHEMLAQSKEHGGELEDDESDEDTGSGMLSVKESEMLKNSSQGLPGFGNPEFEDSSSDDEVDKADRVGRRHRTSASAATSSSRHGRRGKKGRRDHDSPPEPPLPGYGSDSLHGMGQGGQRRDESKSLMDRLVDRLQELTAPPPPMAMHAAKRQQERRRQKLFVGEYSMADGTFDMVASIPKGTSASGMSSSGDLGDPLASSSASLAKGPTGSTVSIMGTNPFRRFPRMPGQILGGWAEPGEDISHTQKWNRTFRPHAITEARHPVSQQVYQLAQSLQMGFIRTSLLAGMRSSNDLDADDGNDGATLSKATNEKDLEEENDDLESDFVLWGTAKSICDVVIKGIADYRQGDGEASKTTAPSSSTGLRTLQVPVITGLLRDMTDWIEQEDWDRRLMVLNVLVPRSGQCRVFLPM